MSGIFHWEADYALEEATGSPVDIHVFESGKEQRRLKQTNLRRSWNLVFNNISLTQINDMKAFFQLQLGSYGTFSWDNPIDSVTYTVRFIDDGFSYQRIIDNVYNLNIGLMEIIE